MTGFTSGRYTAKRVGKRSKDGGPKEGNLVKGDW